MDETAHRTPITTLPPFDRSKEERNARKVMMPLVRKVIKAIVIDRPNEDMLAEIYFAGMWHAAEVLRQQDLPPPPPPRQRDVIIVGKGRRRLSLPQGGAV